MPSLRQIAENYGLEELNQRCADAMAEHYESLRVDGGPLWALKLPVWQKLVQYAARAFYASF